MHMFSSFSLVTCSQLHWMLWSLLSSSNLMSISPSTLCNSLTLLSSSQHPRCQHLLPGLQKLLSPLLSYFNCTPGHSQHHLPKSLWSSFSSSTEPTHLLYEAALWTVSLNCFPQGLEVVYTGREWSTLPVLSPPYPTQVMVMHETSLNLPTDLGQSLCVGAVRESCLTTKWLK